MSGTTRKRHVRAPAVLLAVVAAGCTAVFPHTVVGLTTDDLLSDPTLLESAAPAAPPAQRGDAVTPLLFLADHHLRQGNWQAAARLAREALSRDGANTRGHAILGLIAALAGQNAQAEEQSAVLQTTKDAGLYAELLAAVLSGQKNNHESAAEHLARALDQEPDHPVALYCSGYLALLRGKTAEAGQAFTAVLRRVPAFAAAHAGLGQVYRLGNQSEKAVAAYQQAVAAEPENLTYRRQLIATLKDTGQKEEEQQATRELLHFLPGVRERSVAQALDLLHQGQYDEAIKQADTLLAVYKKFPVGHYLKAAALINKGDREGAAGSLRSLLAEGSGLVQTHHEAGLCYLALGDLDKAEEQFKLALSLAPDNARSFVFLPIIEQLRGKPDTAADGLSVMLGHNEPPALTHYLLAHVSLAGGKTSEYQQEIHKAEALVPGLRREAFAVSPPPGGAAEIGRHRNLMVLYYLNGWYEQAAKQSALLVQTIPTDPFALWYGSLARMAQKRFADAQTGLQKLVELDPDMAAAHMELGKAYAQMQDREKALAAFQRAAGIPPAHAEAFVAMGDLQLRKGDDAAAAEAYRKAIAIEPKALPAYTQLALLLAQQPETAEEARQLAEKAVALAPEDPAALDALGWALVQQGQLKAGIEKIQLALGSVPQSPLFLYHLGLGLNKDNQFDQARQALQQALALSKDFRGHAQAAETLLKIEQKQSAKP